MTAREKKRGFTLLEIMFAVAILGLALSAIFSSEAAAIRMAAQARRITSATLLARCKMGEIEEKVMREGLPAISERDSDRCCEGGEVEGFTCDYEITRVVLPDPAASDPNATGNGAGAAGAAGANGAPPNALNMDSISGLTGGTDLRTNATSIVSGAMSGGGDMLSQLAMQFVFPVLKPYIEEQVRRVKVTVKWREGTRERTFDLSQFLVAEQPPAMPANPTNPSVVDPNNPQNPSNPSNPSNPTPQVPR